jgi:hypothetical protein
MILAVRINTAKVYKRSFDRKVAKLIKRLSNILYLYLLRGPPDSSTHDQRLAPSQSTAGVTMDNKKRPKICNTRINGQKKYQRRKTGIRKRRL